MKAMQNMKCWTSMMIDDRLGSIEYYYLSCTIPIPIPIPIPIYCVSPLEPLEPFFCPRVFSKTPL